MRKNSVVTFLIFFFLFFSFIYSQTVDEIISKNIETKGGLEKLKSIKSMKMTGKVFAGGFEMSMILWAKRPNMSRMEAVFQDQKIVQAYDGEKAWQINPFMGSNEPQEIKGLQAEDLKDRADFDGPLVDYKKKGHKVEFMGKEDLEGTEVYKLKVTMKNGRVVYLYLDTDSCIELKQSTTVNYQGNEYLVETIFGDYKEVDGIMVPHFIETKLNGQTQAQITIEKVEFNIKIDDNFFKMPAKEKQ
ncbi:outer membrane lipoprotein-sorting protein [Candidatus Aminicenantes bacterium AC-708-M15]|jgi:outer membrane lipoprotein-sorting protein|nr:outer membrane lipoprotein-sorting protein [SCandidatus Aminicenantes bacterium Aminicenantia_JdfR_composite]MCP2597263.1 outer membrane lipoprotein-sorting protein [Candidatus Aminicenantes bacterium AC-335-G13]MCP2604405.1 outer membrane lipoprotein-sorting protein [Candidatus Aminicenantes bacterium AC-708-M15]